MKKLILSLTAILSIVIMSTNVMAQDKATATNVSATALIVSTLTIENDIPLDFGTMSIPNSDLIVTYQTSGSRYTANSSNIALLPSSTGTLAHFKVTGENSYNYTITLPTSDIILTDGDNLMKVNAFTPLTKSNPGPNVNNGKLDGSGKDDFVVGADLHISASQPAGKYDGKFDVTVTYD